MTIEPRSNYKDVWMALSDTLPRAVAHVMGEVSEEALHAAGQDTVQNLIETVGVDASDSILEIGCGVGRVGKALAPLCQEWTGCDVSSNMLNFAEQRLQGLKNTRLIEISGYDLSPIADESVDVVYCTVVFMHLDEWDRYNYILEARRVLRAGGRLFVDNFSLCSDIGWQVFETHRTAFAPQARPAHISKSSTPDEIEAYLKHADLSSYQVRLQNEWIQGWGVK